MQAWVTGVAVWGPGLPGWAASQPVLAGAEPFAPVDTPPPLPSILPATERRRTGLAVRLALAVAQQAMEMAARQPGAIPSVFGSANGDGIVVHNILIAISGNDGPAAAVQVSPTQFHNSVHNAAAGYWTIGTQSQAAATSLGCHDATFAAALLKAMAELHVERHPVLLCVYDGMLPELLLAQRPIGAPFAAAFVLDPNPSPTALAHIAVAYHPDPPPPEQEAPLNPDFQSLANANPAARSLRLLEHLARRQPGAIAARLLDGRIDILFAPC